MLCDSKQVLWIDGILVCHTMTFGFVWKENREEKHRPHIHHSYKYNYRLIHHNLKS